VSTYPYVDTILLVATSKIKMGAGRIRCAGRPVAIERKASMPPSSRRAFHVYAVWRAKPAALAASAGVLPANIKRPARTR
jgi:hypothetical protein